MKKLVLVLVAMLTISGMAFADFKASFTAGLTKLGANDYQGAVTDFTTAIGLTTIADEKAQAQCWIGSAYCQAKDWVTAETELKKVLAIANINPNIISQANFQIGTTYWQRNDMVTARSYCVKAATEVGVADFNLTRAQFRVGQTYEAENNLPSAITEWQKVLVIVGDEMLYKAYASMEIGKTYSRLKQEDNSQTAFKNVILNYGDSKTLELCQQAFDKIKIEKLTIAEKKTLYEKVLNVFATPEGAVEKYAGFLGKVKGMYEVVK